MGDYTPRTETVREAWQYANGACDCCRNGFHKPVYEAFDRWHAEELRKAKAEALREAAERLEESTRADANNYIGRPRPTFGHSDRYADVQWLKQRAADIEGGGTR